MKLSNKIHQRNRQIRCMRRKLAELMDVLGDAKIQPPIPQELRKWARKQIKKI